MLVKMMAEKSRMYRTGTGINSLSRMSEKGQRTTYVAEFRVIQERRLRRGVRESVFRSLWVPPIPSRVRKGR
ncbi:hypothetical protein V3C99_016695 [Haemonchus contortus]